MVSASMLDQQKSSRLRANRTRLTVRVPTSTRTMRPASVLRMYTAHLTLFTHQHCSLCHVAKASLATFLERRPVSHAEIDIFEPEHKQWRDLYEYDVPVLHVERVHHTYSKPDLKTMVAKVMHRFTDKDVEAAVDQAEGADDPTARGAG